MMTRLLYCFLATVSVAGLENQRSYTLEYTYQVELFLGLTNYGGNAVIYNQEGLILRKANLTATGQPSTQRVFVDIDSLYGEKRLMLNQFLIRHNGLDKLHSEYVDDGNWLLYPLQYVIRGGKDEYFKLITDKNYNGRSKTSSTDEALLDSLVFLMNSLIPDEHEEFKIK